MAVRKALALVGGDFQQIQTADTLDVGTVTPSSGSLTLAGASGSGLLGTLSDNIATALSIAEGANSYVKITTTNGTEIMELGNATTNPDLTVLGTGDISMAGGTLNVPSGTSFKIGGSALTSANFTAATLSESMEFFFATGITGAEAETLTDGSNADSLHTHTSVDADQVAVTYTADGTGVGAGDAVYINSSATITKAIATSSAAAQAFGVAELAISAAGSGTVTVEGVVETAKFVAGLTLADGEKVYLSAATAGALTNVAPSTAGQVVKHVGYIKDKTGYNGTTVLVADVQLDFRAAIVL